MAGKWSKMLGKGQNTPKRLQIFAVHGIFEEKSSFLSEKQEVNKMLKSGCIQNLAELHAPKPKPRPARHPGPKRGGGHVIATRVAITCNPGYTLLYPGLQ